MKKSSMILKMLCLAMAVALCLSVATAFAEEAAETEDETAVTEAVADEEIIEDVTGAEAEEPFEDETEEAVLDLFEATLRDGGVYITPGDVNNAAFNYDGLRYKVNAGQGNGIKLDGFESNPAIETEPLAPNAKNRLYTTGEIAVEAAHSGYFGLSLPTGDFVYRTAVAGGSIYAFSAWIKMPARGSLNDNGREFKVIAENGNTYVVGYNEIGREVAATGAWQQVLFTFKAPETGLFEIDFTYKGAQALAIDDIELYEAEIFDNPLEIKTVVCKDAAGNKYDQSSGFSTSGTLTHTTTLYNSDEDDVFFTAVMALFKDDILIDIDTVSDCALVLDETEVTFEIEIPEDDDLSGYKYMVYFINDTMPTQYYGKVPSRTNPYIVKGN